MTATKLPDDEVIEDDDEETYRFTIEVEDNREPQPSAADTFIYTFVKVIHYWITAGVVILLLGALLTVIVWRL